MKSSHQRFFYMLSYLILKDVLEYMTRIRIRAENVNSYEAQQDCYGFGTYSDIKISYQNAL